MRISDWSSDVCSSDLRRSDAHPHQPAAFAHLARLRAAGAPSEALRSGLEAADQIALRKGPSRIFGIDLRVINDAKRDRVEPGFFSDFINGTFQTHHSRRFTGREIGSASCRERGCQYVSFSLGAG